MYALLSILFLFLICVDAIFQQSHAIAHSSWARMIKTRTAESDRFSCAVSAETDQNAVAHANSNRSCYEQCSASVCWIYFKKRPTALVQFRSAPGNSLRASVRGSSIQSSLSTTPDSPSYSKVKAWEQRSQSQKCFTPCRLLAESVMLGVEFRAASPGRKRKNLPPSSQ